MHELSIASSIVESLVEFAKRSGISKVVEVRLVIGEFTCIEEEQLRFCIGVVTHNTEIEGLGVVIETVKAAVRCPHCSYEGAPTYWEGVFSAALCPTLQCPQCGWATEAVAGHECAIKNLKCLRTPSAASSLKTGLRTANEPADAPEMPDPTLPLGYGGNHSGG